MKDWLMNLPEWSIYVVISGIVMVAALLLWLELTA